jgi:hypothetical protein
MNTPLRDNQTTSTGSPEQLLSEAVRVLTEAARTTSDVLPARQVRWTRLGAGMGYTNTEPKREQIRAAVAAMDWVEPEQLRDVLDAPIIRFYVTGLFFGRAWALTAAAVTPAPAGIAMDPFRDRCPWRLIGLQAVTDERYMLLDLGYEAINLYHDRPAAEQVMPR